MNTSTRFGHPPGPRFNTACSTNLVSVFTNQPISPDARLHKTFRLLISASLFETLFAHSLDSWAFLVFHSLVLTKITCAHSIPTRYHAHLYQNPAIQPSDSLHNLRQITLAIRLILPPLFVHHKLPGLSH